jgi:hypothetical protein
MILSALCGLLIKILLSGGSRIDGDPRRLTFNLPLEFRSFDKTPWLLQALGVTMGTLELGLFAHGPFRQGARGNVREIRPIR